MFYEPPPQRLTKPIKPELEGVSLKSRDTERHITLYKAFPECPTTEYLFLVMVCIGLCDVRIT
jgi:hypothetical protein